MPDTTPSRAESTLTVRWVKRYQPRLSPTPLMARRRRAIPSFGPSRSRGDGRRLDPGLRDRRRSVPAAEPTRPTCGLQMGCCGEDGESRPNGDRREPGVEGLVLIKRATPVGRKGRGRMNRKSVRKSPRKLSAAALAARAAREARVQRVQIALGYAFVGLSVAIGLVMCAFPRLFGLSHSNPAVVIGLALLAGFRLYALRRELRAQERQDLLIGGGPS